MNFKPGDTVVVEIDGETVITTIDKNSVQRLPKDPIVDKLINSGVLDLNSVAIAARGVSFPRAIGLNGSFTEDDRYMLYRDYLGFSVSGFLDVFPDAKIRNPLWEKE